MATAIRPSGENIGYGGLSIHAASAGQVFATGAAQKFTLWETAVPETGEVDGQVANDRIVVAHAGVYFVGWHMSYEVSGNAVWIGHIYLDGVDGGIGWARIVNNPDRPGSISCSGPLTIPAGGVIEAYLEHDQGGDITCTPSDAQMYAVRIG